MIVGVINNKGGVGKTTSTYVLGELASRKGLKVLIVGLDGQRNIDQMYGVDEESDVSLFLDCPEECVCSIRDNLDLIPTPSPEELDEELDYGDTTTLSSALQSVVDDYDVVFIDSPPSRGKVFYNIISASDKYVIPMKPSYFDVTGCDRLLDLITGEKGCEVGKDVVLIPTMFRKSRDCLNGVSIVYSFAISAYNDFKVSGLDVHEALLQKKDAKGRLVKDLPKDVARIKRRLSLVCREYGLEYDRECLINPVPEAVVYMKLFKYSDFKQVMDDRLSFVKNFHPYTMVLNRLVDYDQG
jgi:cellulose biosynthesis protein BcsQ